MKEMQHIGTGSTDLHKAQLLLLFWGGNAPPVWAGFMDAVGLCSTCWAHLLHIQCAGDTGLCPWVTASSCLGQNTEWVSSASTQELPAAALALGYPLHGLRVHGRASAPLRAVFPPAAQAPSIQVAAEQGHTSVPAGNATTQAPRQGSSSRLAKHKP